MFFSSLHILGFLGFLPVCRTKTSAHHENKALPSLQQLPSFPLSVKLLNPSLALSSIFGARTFNVLSSLSKMVSTSNLHVSATLNIKPHGAQGCLTGKMNCHLVAGSSIKMSARLEQKKRILSLTQQLKVMRRGRWWLTCAESPGPGTSHCRALKWMEVPLRKQLKAAGQPVAARTWQHSLH